MRLFHCSFCKDKLSPTPPRGVEWLWTVVLLRCYVCPHCREGYVRPIFTLRNYFGRPQHDVRKSTNTKGWKLGAPSIKSSRSSDSSNRSSGSRSSSSRRSKSSRSRSKSSRSSSSVSVTRSEAKDVVLKRDEEPVVHTQQTPDAHDIEYGDQTVQEHAQHINRPETDSVETTERSTDEREFSERHDDEFRERRSRRSSSSRKSREHRDLKRRDATIASLSSQSRPTNYGSGGLVYRMYRKLRRRTRKALGLSKRKSSSKGSKRSY